jgi:hydrogenase maturation protease
MRPPLILCLGNEILTDDSFGFRIAQILQKQSVCSDNIEVIFASLAGFGLLDLLEKRDRVLIVDSIVTGEAEPGTLHFFESGHFAPAKNLTCSHQISLPVAITFGRELGMDMPNQIDILAVEAHDVETLSERMTAAVEAAIVPAIKRIHEWIDCESERAKKSNLAVEFK